MNFNASSYLIVEAAGFSEIRVNVYQVIRFHITYLFVDITSVTSLGKIGSSLKISASVLFNFLVPKTYP